MIKKKSSADIGLGIFKIYIMVWALATIWYGGWFVYTGIDRSYFVYCGILGAVWVFFYLLFEK